MMNAREKSDSAIVAEKSSNKTGNRKVTPHAETMERRAEAKENAKQQSTRRAQNLCPVNWDEAQQYITWFSKMTGQSYRLLTEAEWEYAARAGTTTAYSWGDEIGTGNASCNGCGSKWDNRETSPAGSFNPNAFGLYDMAGNVWQWVEDCYHSNYNDAPTDGSSWTSGDCGRRAVRGGSWINSPQYLRSAEGFREIRAAKRGQVRGKSL